MDDRERVKDVTATYLAAQILPTGRGIPYFCKEPTGWDAIASDIADAVLAALGDRLLPELPVWVERVNLSLHESSFDAEGPITIFHDGSGPTIAAAIRDAVGEG